MIVARLVKIYWSILHTKYLSSKSYGCAEENALIPEITFSSVNQDNHAKLTFTLKIKGLVQIRVLYLQRTWMLSVAEAKVTLRLK